mmetsp:Transcript_53922/g.167114  ORF Transcript_53922/g.167114 Transcript_53922/m.167114 type:complete len:236 (+) Transcript_53922:1592-2299(+)
MPMVSAFNKISEPMRLSNFVLFKKSWAVMSLMPFMEPVLLALLRQTSTASESRLASGLAPEILEAASTCPSSRAPPATSLHAQKPDASLDFSLMVSMFSSTMTFLRWPPAAASAWLCTSGGNFDFSKALRSSSRTEGGSGGCSTWKGSSGGVSSGAESGHLGSLGLAGVLGEIAVSGVEVLVFVKRSFRAVFLDVLLIFAGGVSIAPNATGPFCRMLPNARAFATWLPSASSICA